VLRTGPLAGVAPCPRLRQPKTRSCSCRASTKWKIHRLTQHLSCRLPKNWRSLTSTKTKGCPSVTMNSTTARRKSTISTRNLTTARDLRAQRSKQALSDSLTVTFTPASNLPRHQAKGILGDIDRPGLRTLWSRIRRQRASFPGLQVSPPVSCRRCGLCLCVSVAD
jgi:hypothetical protein